MRSKTLAVVSVLWMFAAGAVAVRSEDHAIGVNVPFAFVIGNETFQPGEYVIGRVRTSTASAHVIKTRKAATMTLTQESGRFSGDTSSVVFNKYGDRHFLSSIRAAESGIVYQLPKSKLEVELIAQGLSPAVEMVAALTR
jgi:hypothetical protein